MGKNSKFSNKVEKLQSKQSECPEYTIHFQKGGKIIFLNIYPLCSQLLNILLSHMYVLFFIDIHIARCYESFPA